MHDMHTLFSYTMPMHCTHALYAYTIHHTPYAIPTQQLEDIERDRGVQMDKERSAVMALQAQVTGLSITQEVMACV
jgi:hypothetical protein